MKITKPKVRDTRFHPYMLGPEGYFLNWSTEQMGPPQIQSGSYQVNFFTHHFFLRLK